MPDKLQTPNLEGKRRSALAGPADRTSPWARVRIRAEVLAGCHAQQMEFGTWSFFGTWGLGACNFPARLPVPPKSAKRPFYQTKPLGTPQPAVARRLPSCTTHCHEERCSEVLARRPRRCPVRMVVMFRKTKPLGRASRRAAAGQLLLPTRGREHGANCHRAAVDVVRSSGVFAKRSQWETKNVDRSELESGREAARRGATGDGMDGILRNEAISRQHWLKRPKNQEGQPCERGILPNEPIGRGPAFRSRRSGRPGEGGAISHSRFQISEELEGRTTNEHEGTRSPAATRPTRRAARRRSCCPGPARI